MQVFRSTGVEGLDLKSSQGKKSPAMDVLGMWRVLACGLASKDVTWHRFDVGHVEWGAERWCYDEEASERNAGERVGE